MEIVVAVIGLIGTIYAAKVARDVRTETKPNGGASLRDAVNRIADRQLSQTVRLADIQDKVDGNTEVLSAHLEHSAQSDQKLEQVVRHLNLESEEK